MSKGNCYNCAYFLSTGFFGGECHNDTKTVYKWAKCHCAQYKPKIFKKREPDDLIMGRAING